MAVLGVPQMPAVPGGDADWQLRRGSSQRAGDSNIREKIRRGHTEISLPAISYGACRAGTVAPREWRPRGLLERG